MITLDAKAIKDVTRVKVRFYSAKFVEELDRLIEAEKAKREKESKKE